MTYSSSLPKAVDRLGSIPSRVELDAGTVDERLPLFAFRIHELRERPGVAAHRLDAGAAYARLKLRVLSDLDQRVTELLANIGRKPGRTEQAHPTGQDEIGESRLGHGRHVWQLFQAFGTQNGQHLQPRTVHI